jgi:kinesin family protein 15
MQELIKTANPYTFFLQNRISHERIRLTELMPQSSPINSRTDENCRTPRRQSQAAFLSALDR